MFLDNASGVEKDVGAGFHLVIHRNSLTRKNMFIIIATLKTIIFYTELLIHTFLQIPVIVYVFPLDGTDLQYNIEMYFGF